MTSGEFGELAQRIDGVAWVLMSLVAQLEIDGHLNSAELCNNLRNTAAGRGRHPELAQSAATIREIADGIDAARSVRPTPARQDHGRRHQT